MKRYRDVRLNSTMPEPEVKVEDIAEELTEDEEIKDDEMITMDEELPEDEEFDVEESDEEGEMLMIRLQTMQKTTNDPTE